MTSKKVTTITMEDKPGIDSLADVYKAPEGQTVTVVGVVTDVMLPPKQTKTGDWMLTFAMVDADLVRIPTPYRGMKARIFCEVGADLPQIKRVGDVVLLRRAKANTYAREPVLSSVKNKTSWVVFPMEGIPDSVNTRLAKQGLFRVEHSLQPRTVAPSIDEMAFVVLVKKLVAEYLDIANPIPGHHLPSIPPVVEGGRRKNTPANASLISTLKQMSLPEPAPKSAGSSAKFSLIKDVTVDKFYDIIAEVVKVFPGQSGMCDIYLTDYTANALLFDYPSPDEEDDGISRDGDAFGYMPMPKREWPGPYGSMVLKIEVHEPHASLVRTKVQEGQIVFIQNVRMKLSNQNKMEGNLWRDSRYPDKVQIHRSAYQDDVKVEEVRQRKNLYWEARKAASRKKDDIGLSKRQRKTRRQKEKKAEEKAAAAQQDQGGKASPPTEVINKHIKCLSKPRISPTTIVDLLCQKHSVTTPSGETVTAPFINQNVQSIIRVIDFVPSILEEFTSRVDATPDNDDDPINADYSIQKWEWGFDLLVEDPDPSPKQGKKTHIWLHVLHEDAEFMLNLDATDLTTDKKTLAQLREKLAILWGNLEERKRAAIDNSEPYPEPDPADPDDIDVPDPLLSNLPFKCCIREYGILVDEEDDHGNGWDRHFGLFGITIQ